MGWLSDGLAPFFSICGIVPSMTEPHRPKLLQSFLIGLFFVGLASLFAYIFMAMPGTALPN
jgi:hypothetical protein